MNNNHLQDLTDRLSNPAFKACYEALAVDDVITRVILDARIARGLTQKELSALVGIDQGDISKLERGMGNTTLKLLQKLAKGLDMELQIKFTITGYLTDHNN